MNTAGLPRLAYFALGGTIASVKTGAGVGASPALSAEDILASVPGVANLAEITATQFLQLPSPEITLPDIVRLCAACRAAVDDGACGIVVTQGTDTLEESAFAFDLLWNSDVPVVFTGSMRNPMLAGSDGPANLCAAIDTALSPQARGGVFLVFNDEIHSARFVRKMHTSSPAAFASPNLGPVGWVVERRVALSFLQPARKPLPLPPDAGIPNVALLKMSMGDDGRLLGTLASVGYSGLVLEAFGGGHMPKATLSALRELVKHMPLVLASRAGAGEVLTSTYGFPGGEIDLLSMGLIHGGGYDGLKARILLSFCIAAGMARGDIEQAFRS